MRLALDATSLTAAGKGLATFQREFLRTARGLLDELIVFVPADVDATALPQEPGWRYVTVSARPMIRWEQLGRPRAARRAGADVVLHLSERASLFGPAQVAYVYEHPRHRAALNRESDASLRQRLVDLSTLALFRLSLRRVRELLVASESTRRDVGRGEVVYPGVGSVFTPCDGGRGYYLHLASSDPRDNSGVVLEAYARLDERPGLVVGGNAPPELVAHARALGLDVEWAGFRTGEALADVYRGAIAYVDPSLYEGFGLQAAEALACGTPVICSNVTSLPEVVGDAGVLLDPRDVDGFAEAMRTIGDRPELRERAAAQGAQFTWERTVRATLAACERAATGAGATAAAS